MNQINYAIAGSYLTPQLPYTDATTPVLSRPQSSTGFYSHNAHAQQLTKPRSNSGTAAYSPHVNEYDFHSAPLQSTGLGIEHDSVDGLSYGNARPLPAAPAPQYYGLAAATDMGASSLKRNPIAIAPSPLNSRKVNVMKRSREDELPSDMQPKRRRHSSLGVQLPELTEEERLLLRLKDDENLMWKDIALRFQHDLGKNHQVPALQMRYKRLREKLRVWTDTDVHALEQARDYWEKFKWDIIATKMLEFGCGEKWPPKYCLRKWEELNPGMDGSKDQGASMRGSEVGSDRGTPDYGTPGIPTPRMR
ncbi:MAG: hypothetical protein M1825_002863 [Sarcosagium campestre]|nr:MAG: hypothetical protein M1825_002863 [Sarcosagium campestre]